MAKSTRALIEELEPTVNRAFRRSVSELANNIDFKRLRRAIERRDLAAVDAALNLDGSFEPLEKAIVKSFEAGGKMTMKIISEIAEEELGG